MNMLSLYDYLGKAAGKDLGKKVSEIASRHNIKREVREISNNKYTGRVFLYPEVFLDQLKKQNYFN